MALNIAPKAYISYLVISLSNLCVQYVMLFHSPQYQTHLHNVYKPLQKNCLTHLHKVCFHSCPQGRCLGNEERRCCPLERTQKEEEREAWGEGHNDTSSLRHSEYTREDFQRCQQLRKVLGKYMCTQESISVLTEDFVDSYVTHGDYI